MIIYPSKSDKYAATDLRNVSFWGECIICKLATDLILQQGQQITFNFCDSLKGIFVQVWWESSKQFKKYINFSGITTYVSHSVTLK